MEIVEYVERRLDYLVNAMDGLVKKHNVYDYLELPLDALKKHHCLAERCAELSILYSKFLKT